LLNKQCALDIMCIFLVPNYRQFSFRYNLSTNQHIVKVLINYLAGYVDRITCLDQIDGKSLSGLNDKKASDFLSLY